MTTYNKKKQTSNADSVHPARRRAEKATRTGGPRVSKTPQHRSTARKTPHPKTIAPRGFGSCYELTPGTWRYELAVTRESDGLKRKVTGTGPSPIVAKQRWDVNARRFLGGTATRQGATTVAGAVALWAEKQVTNSAESARRVRRTLELHVLPRLPKGFTLGSLTTDYTRTFMARLEATLTPAVYRNAFSALSTLLTWCMHEGYIGTQPLRSLPSPRKNHRKRSLADSQIDRWVEDYLTTLGRLRATQDARYYWALVMSLGLRRSELAGLEWSSIEDLDGPNPVLVIDRQVRRNPHRIEAGTKTGLTRRVPLAPMYAEALREWQTMWSAPTVETDVWAMDQIFTHRTESGEVVGMKAERVYRLWGSALRDTVDPAGVMTDEEWKSRSFSPHDVRRVSASLMAGAGVDVETRKSILGHVTDSMASHYVSAMEVPKQNAVAGLATAVGSTNPKVVVDAQVRGLDGPRNDPFNK